MPINHYTWIVNPILPRLCELVVRQKRILAGLGRLCNVVRVKCISFNKWELQAWPVLKPHRSDLNCLSPPNGWRSGENRDESGYKSFFEDAEYE